MAKTENTSIKLSEYTALTYDIQNLYLTIDLGLEKTKVTSVMSIKRKSESEDNGYVFDGEDIELQSIFIDEKELSSGEFKVERNKLTFFCSKDSFELKIISFINPLKNTALEGIYRSGDIYCTQCEAEGFRRITFYPDRPDNMTKFVTKIIGDKQTEPFLLSNGNLIEKGDLENGRHFAVWEDPFRKPSYLFAMVAGDLGLVKDKYTTRSGREVALEIYVDKGNEEKPLMQWSP